MKNLMKAASKRTTESWPTMSPCVKDRLFERREVSYEFLGREMHFIKGSRLAHVGSGFVAHILSVAMFYVLTGRQRECRWSEALATIYDGFSVTSAWSLCSICVEEWELECLFAAPQFRFSES